MKKFYRYELYCDNEYQDVGIFHGLTELDLEKETEDILLAPFDEKLLYPPICEKCEFLFTEKGNELFKAHIQSIIQAFNDSGLFDVRQLIVEHIDPNNIIYEDSYQIAVPTGFLDKWRTVS